jgi:chromosome segregation and condensation protein ScpB
MVRFISNPAVFGSLSLGNSVIVSEFYRHHLASNRQLAFVGLQLRIVNGVVSLLTSQVSSKALAAYLSEHNGANGISGLTTATLEVLACIPFKQPISQAEIDRLFDADRRGLVVKLRDLKLVEEFAGPDGRLRFATTQAFLQRFGLASLQELGIRLTLRNGNNRTLVRWKTAQGVRQDP